MCYVDRLEGSRFGMGPASLANFVSTLIPLRRVKTSGSPERLIGFAALRLGVSES
jgi:hypothetical protein